MLLNLFHTYLVKKINTDGDISNHNIYSITIVDEFHNSYYINFNDLNTKQWIGINDIYKNFDIIEDISDYDYNHN